MEEKRKKKEGCEKRENEGEGGGGSEEEEEREREESEIHENSLEFERNLSSRVISIASDRLRPFT